MVNQGVKGLGRDRMLEEIEKVYRDCYHAFLRVASAVTEDVELGHDAVQEGFAGAVRSRHSYRARGSLEAWIWRSVVNAARDRSRARPEVPLAVDPVALDVGADPGVLRSAIARLPERQRLAVFLRYFADLDQHSIGKALGIRPGTVAATLHAARGSLRKNLEEVEAWRR
jgi:DNA-directed RNA polymerase specialized sigma24 family protein